MQHIGKAQDWWWWWGGKGVSVAKWRNRFQGKCLIHIQKGGGLCSFECINELGRGVPVVLLHCDL